MLLLDVTHTSHTRAQTGIQRVVRSAHAALAAHGAVAPVCFDPFLDGWRPLDAAEAERLEPGGAPAGSRGAKWTLGRRLRSHAARLAGRRPALPEAGGLVCPELFSPKVAARLPELFARTHGPRVAVFHDAIGLQLPELTPPATVARLPAYLRELRQFDGVAAVSEDSAASLRDYWRWLGGASPPPVQPIPLGLDPAAADAPVPAAGGPPRILCVATIEGRKNHGALLAACEELWDAGRVFELELVGLGRADTAAAALATIRRLRAAGRPLTWAGAVDDAALEVAYRRCTFTVYPSVREGFGLPVLESLRHGRPCVCSGAGALGESARGGGCVPLDAVDAPALARAIRALLDEPARLAALAGEARARRFRSWGDYAADLAAWMESLPARR
ncbi:MAG TPA: glycosyltransferase [Opitutaceae bacterium]|nr:glycosyltransferase [Opitutaceae bacterium]